MRLTRASPRPSWSVVLRRLKPREGPAAGEPLVALFVEDGTGEPHGVAAALCATFELTAREAALAAELAQGRDLRGTAAALGLSLGTARNYLKAVFLKTHTHRQAELVGLILRTTRFCR